MTQAHNGARSGLGLWVKGSSLLVRSSFAGLETRSGDPQRYEYPRFSQRVVSQKWQISRASTIDKGDLRPWTIIGKISK
jgi:hypothetical protein